MNITTDVKIIHSGTFVASLSPVEKVMESEACSYTQGNTLPPALNKLLKKTSKRVTGKQRNLVRELLLKHRNLFASNDQELGKTGIVRHGIKTDSRAPIKQPLRRIPVNIREEIDKHIDDMLERDVIEPSVGRWAAGVVLAKKKDGTT